MAESIIQVNTVDPIVIYGVNDSKLEKLREYFPKLKLIARGDVIRVIGDPEEIARFEKTLNMFIAHFDKYGSLTEANIEHLMSGGENGEKPQAFMAPCLECSRT